MRRSLTTALCAMLLAGSLVACGGDDAAELFLRPLTPNVAQLSIPVGTSTNVTVTLSEIPGEDQVIDIKNDFKEFLTVVPEGTPSGAEPPSSFKIRPKDDPPKKNVVIKAIKANASAVAITFTLRGTTSEKTIKVLPEGV